MQAPIDKLSQLQSIISKMTINECCSLVLPEFRVRWQQISRVVRNYRLPMTSASVAQVLCIQARAALHSDQVDQVLGRITLKYVATHPRTWRAVRLLEPTHTTATHQLSTIHRRLNDVLRSNKMGDAQVQSIMLDSLVYLSVQTNKSTLYIATAPPGEIAVVSSLANKKLLAACVQGLGYAQFEDANLHGRDIPSLLRIANPISNGQAEHLNSLPPYEPAPCILPNGIDYTNKTYDENYVNTILGPNPPLLTDLNIKMVNHFYDRKVLNKKINLTIKLKSEDVAKSLKSWVAKGALAPNSDLFQIFHSIKSNEITYKGDSD